MKSKILKTIILTILLVSLSCAGEKRIHRIVQRFQEFEGYYTKPSIGCCHIWTLYRRHGYSPKEQIEEWDSLPQELTTNIDQYLDSVVGNDWEKTLQFKVFDISEKVHYSKDSTRSFSKLVYKMWFTYNITDTTYYTYIHTNDVGDTPSLDNVEIITSKPQKIRSISKLWKEKVEAGELPLRARPMEIALTHNRLTKEFCWRVCYYSGLFGFIGPKYMVKLDPYSGKILSKRKL